MTRPPIFARIDQALNALDTAQAQLNNVRFARSNPQPVTPIHSKLDKVRDELVAITSQLELTGWEDEFCVNDGHVPAGQRPTNVSLTLTNDQAVELAEFLILADSKEYPTSAFLVGLADEIYDTVIAPEEADA